MPVYYSVSVLPELCISTLLRSDTNCVEKTQFSLIVNILSFHTYALAHKYTCCPALLYQQFKRVLHLEMSNTAINLTSISAVSELKNK